MDLNPVTNLADSSDIGMMSCVHPKLDTRVTDENGAHSPLPILALKCQYDL